MGVSDQSPSEYALQDPTFLSSTEESLHVQTCMFWVNGDAEATFNLFAVLGIYKLYVTNAKFRIKVREML